LDGFGFKVEKTSNGRILVRGRIFDENKPKTFNQPWAAEEQKRLEELLVQFPSEDVEMERWKKVAAALGNRTAVQVQSRVQKYFLKLQKAGLPIPSQRVAKVGKNRYRSRNGSTQLFFLYAYLFLLLETISQSHPAPTFCQRKSARRSFQAWLQT
jgi:hypothetical protein